MELVTLHTNVNNLRTDVNFVVDDVPAPSVQSTVLSDARTVMHTRFNVHDLERVDCFDELRELQLN